MTNITLNGVSSSKNQPAGRQAGNHDLGDFPEEIQFKGWIMAPDVQI